MGPRNRPIVLALVATALVLFALAAIVGGVRPYPAWLLAWSVATFAAYAIDKAQARRGGWRIPELALHGMALAGGAIGGWFGLLALHHKTRHPAFPLVLGLALVAQAVVWDALGSS
jgi:uncharacterized membrane protein YsdA (DUF1294 family)